jgi:hypothetical protein
LGRGKRSEILVVIQGAKYVRLGVYESLQRETLTLIYRAAEENRCHRCEDASVTLADRTPWRWKVEKQRESLAALYRVAKENPYHQCEGASTGLADPSP